MEDYSSEINNLIYVDRDIEDAKWEKIGREIAKNEGYNDEKVMALLKDKLLVNKKNNKKWLKNY